MKRFITSSLVLVTVLIAHGRMVFSWDYQHLFDVADIVVVAKLASTQDATRKMLLPKFHPEVEVVSVSSEFEIAVVKKGDPSLKRLVLNHYRFFKSPLLTNAPSFGVPDLITFDARKSPYFLMFLHRDSFGNYLPATGQIDPAVESVLELVGGPQAPYKFASSRSRVTLP